VNSFCIESPVAREQRNI